MLIKEIRKKYLNDLLVYLQKTYGLYFIEFRKAPNGRDAIVLCHPNNKHWWINILILNHFKIDVTVACAGENDETKEEVVQNIRNGKYKGCARKHIGKWLRL